MQESTLLRLAERQAGREEELLASKQKVAELEAELSDLQREVELRQEQESALKEARPLPCPRCFVAHHAAGMSVSALTWMCSAIARRS